MKDSRSKARREAQRLCGYREMPNAPCAAPVSWVITIGDGSSHQFACEKHRNAILAKVTTAHRVLPLAEWLAGPRGQAAKPRDKGTGAGR
jgi:hypothetical protein